MARAIECGRARDGPCSVSSVIHNPPMCPSIDDFADCPIFRSSVSRNSPMCPSIDDFADCPIFRSSVSHTSPMCPSIDDLADCPIFRSSVSRTSPMCPSIDAATRRGRRAPVVGARAIDARAMAPSTRSSLEAIAYSRGSLVVIDQLALPNETKAIAIASCDDAWTCIKEMRVRGAPAIAMTAALSLAIELNDSGRGFITGADVEEYAKKRTARLKTSRPTAVNLAEAMARVEDVARRMRTSDAASAIEAIVSECEKMMEEDVKACRAIGAHGAEALLAACDAKDGRKISVMTCCNTGSLATAGYGTALGVIRALHERGRLEMVYCLETRPYNQGSRLTAYELVYEKIPGTLICDNMAAALMARGKVDAIVVGADRVAANGDFANKIGTYSLAVNAKYHGLPMFTAAPVTTLDPATAKGEDIHIEERPAIEVTHSLGQRVAAEGIDVWNPSFDVTPAALIAGVITEHGVIEKDASGVFPVGEFVAKVKGSDIIARKASFPSGFFALNCETVLDYALSRGNVAAVLGGAETRNAWTAKEIGDGNINFVYIITGASPDKCVIVKQGLPYVRCVGESWPLTQERVRYEAEALIQAHMFCSAHVPEVYVYDAALAVIVMRYLEPPHIILRGGIIEGKVYPRLAEHVGEYLATTLYKSSALAVGGAGLRRARQAFGQNEDMCELTEQVIFTEPYGKADNNHWTTPQLDDIVREIQSDAELKRAINALKEKFMTEGQALLHGDLHTGSLMCTESTTYAIDHEFAFYGPMGFDIGAFLANILLAYYSQSGWESCNGDDRSNQREWLLGSFKSTWDVFETRFMQQWNEQGVRDDHGSLSPVAHYGAGVQGGADALEAHQRTFLRKVWVDSLGFAGAKMIRRIIGIAHVADLEKIPEVEVRARCERAALRCGRALVLGASTLATPDSVIEMVRSTPSICEYFRRKPEQ